MLFTLNPKETLLEKGVEKPRLGLFSEPLDQEYGTLAGLFA